MASSSLTRSGEMMESAVSLEHLAHFFTRCCTMCITNLLKPTGYVMHQPI